MPFSPPFPFGRRKSGGEEWKGIGKKGREEGSEREENREGKERKGKREE